LTDRPLKVGVVGVSDRWSSEALADAVAARTGSRILIDMGRVETALSSGRVIFGNIDLASLDGLIVKKIDAIYSPSLVDRLEILRFLEAQGVAIFSKPASMLRLVNRLACTVTLRNAGIPMPQTVITEDVEIAIEAVRRLGRAVLKPLFSTKARGMLLIDCAEPGWQEAVRTFNVGNPVIYLQQMVDMPGRDLGVAFLGGRYLATYARVGNHDSWNTTTLSGGRYAAHEPSAAVLELATRAQAPFGLDFTCVDVVETDRGPMVFEVSAFGGFRGLMDAFGIDAAALYADHVCQVLNMKRAKFA
jgi:ribosomal protein S6--L-glutamate ligase